jgi:hypothetical protein
MPTAKKAAAKKAATKKAAAKKKVVKKIARAAKAPKKKSAPPARRVAQPSAECREQCRVCGNVCSRDGLHEQHRCRDHVGLSM